MYEHLPIETVRELLEQADFWARVRIRLGGKK
jgi:hypothetical protein